MEDEVLFSLAVDSSHVAAFSQEVVPEGVAVRAGRLTGVGEIQGEAGTALVGGGVDIDHSRRWWRCALGWRRGGASLDGRRPERAAIQFLYSRVNKKVRNAITLSLELPEILYCLCNPHLTWPNILLCYSAFVSN